MTYPRKHKNVDLYNDGDTFSLLIRTKCPKGWIVERIFQHNGATPTTSMCFVPDPKHDWELEDLEGE